MRVLPVSAAGHSGRSQKAAEAPESRWLVYRVAVGITGREGRSLVTGPDWYQQLGILQGTR